MKTMGMIAICLVIIPGMAAAQEVQNKNNNKPSGNDAPVEKAVKEGEIKRDRFNSWSRVLPISAMDQMKIYHWGTGQRATPTGRQAGDRHAIYARVYGDSAIVVPRREIED